VELGHGIRLSLMEGVVRMFEQGKVRFSSLHNFCPLPIEITRASPDCYKFSSPDERERDRAIRFSFQTIDFAARLEAPLVVLHLGRTPIDDYTSKLIQLAEGGLIQSRTFSELCDEGILKREATAANYLERSKECLAIIAEHAEKRGIKLGIESRHSFEEIPSEREMAGLLEQFPQPHIGYWHDFGHVQVKHNLGLVNHVKWMKRVASRLIGCHLHDTVWPGQDHMPPFSGDVAYDELLALIPKEMLFVFEMGPRRTRQEIVAAREKWIARFGV
jgi:sugar phosphate isomerase/epimerase